MAKASKQAPLKDDEVEQPKKNPFGKQHYQEWRVEIKDKKAEKLKIVRPRVLITDQQADTLNHGVLNGGNTYASMYFKPEN